MKLSYFRLFVITVAVILFLGIYFWSMRGLSIASFKVSQKKAVVSSPSPTSSITPTPTDGRVDSGNVLENDKIKVETSYSENKLNYTITADVPTPCYSLSINPQLQKIPPSVLKLNVTTKNPKPEIKCAEVITKKSLSGQISISPETTIEVYLNGELQPKGTY